MIPETTRRAEFLAGVRDTLPLVLGALPFGIIFGALAVGAGLSPAGTLAMSAFVFAGSSQFIAANLLQDQAATLIIIITTLVVNLRHVLYSITLGSRLGKLPQRWLAPLGFWLTDETFAVVSGRMARQDGAIPYLHWYQLGSSLAMYINWQLCTFIGVLAGQAIPDAQNWGLDFAMVVTFIGIVVPLVKDRPAVIAVLVAGVTALLTNVLPNRIGLMIASLAGIAAGIAAEMLTRRSATITSEEVA